MRKDRHCVMKFEAGLHKNLIAGSATEQTNALLNTFWTWWQALLVLQKKHACGIDTKAKKLFWYGEFCWSGFVNTTPHSSALLLGGSSPVHKYLTRIPNNIYPVFSWSSSYGCSHITLIVEYCLPHPLSLAHCLFWLHSSPAAYRLHSRTTGCQVPKPRCLSLRYLELTV